MFEDVFVNIHFLSNKMVYPLCIFLTISPHLNKEKENMFSILFLFIYLFLFAFKLRVSIEQRTLITLLRKPHSLKHTPLLMGKIYILQL